MNRFFVVFALLSALFVCTRASENAEKPDACCSECDECCGADSFSDEALSLDDSESWEEF